MPIDVEAIDTLTAEDSSADPSTSTAHDQIVPVDIISIAAASEPLHYGTIADANAYMSTKLYSSIWFKAPTERKTVALIEATRLIDRQAFQGDKADPDQPLEHPRDEGPEDQEPIAKATYEIALELLRGFNLERTLESISLEGQGFASARILRNVLRTPAHLEAGIPSAIAWSLLAPYLVDRRHLTLE